MRSAAIAALVAAFSLSGCSWLPSWLGGPPSRAVQPTALTEIKPPYVPKLEEVKDKVKEDVIRIKAVDLAKSKAVTMAQAIAKAIADGTPSRIGAQIASAVST